MGIDFRTCQGNDAQQAAGKDGRGRCIGQPQDDADRDENQQDADFAPKQKPAGCLEVMDPAVPHDIFVIVVVVAVTQDGARPRGLRRAAGRFGVSVVVGHVNLVQLLVVDQFYTWCI